MKHIDLIIAVLMGISFALAALTLEKDPIQDVAGSLDAAASVFLKTLNNSVPALGPKPISTPGPFDGALLKTRDLSYVHCDLWEYDIGGPDPLYRTSPDKVRNNINKLRSRSDKPKTVANGHCERAICEENSGIAWCVNVTDSHSYTVENWSVIADAAQAAMDTCSPKTDNGWFDGVAMYQDSPSALWGSLVSYCT